MGNSKPLLVKPSTPEIITIFRQLMPTEVIKELLHASGVTLYWRLLTPLVLLWCFIYQRLSKDHTCDEVLSHLRSGDADHLVSKEGKAPLSQELKSENTSAYVQGRNRLPLSVLVGALRHTYKVISSELSDDNRCFSGHSVRYMDGTTFRLRPFGDLEETYGKAENQHGKSYWVVTFGASWMTFGF
jgi:hypothetical protein